MDFKLDDNLKKLEEVSNLGDAFTMCALNELNEREIIFDDYIPEYFGQRLKDCQERDVNINEIKEMLHILGIKHADGDILDAFGNLVLMGGYDCPECGGRMDYVGDSEETQGDGYYTPREPMCEIWKCPVCGHIEKR